MTAVAKTATTRRRAAPREATRLRGDLRTLARTDRRLWLFAYGLIALQGSCGIVALYGSVLGLSS